MNFLPVTSDVQTLELVYTLHPTLSEQFLSISECTELSLGLIETNVLKAVLSAQPGFAQLARTTITLRKIGLETLENRKSLVRLEPLQQMNLRFESGKAILDDIPQMLPEDTPYYALVQHLMMGRLEHALAEMDVFYLQVSAEINEEFADLLHLRGYRYNHIGLSKYLLMTSTVEVIP